MAQKIYLPHSNSSQGTAASFVATCLCSSHIHKMWHFQVTTYKCKQHSANILVLPQNADGTSQSQLHSI